MISQEGAESSKDNLQRLNEEVLGLLDLAIEFGIEADAEALPLKILEKSKVWMQVDACSLLSLDPSTGELVVSYALGGSASQVSNLRIPPKRGICGACIESKEAIIVDDAGADHRFFAEIERLSGYKAKSIIAAPLLSGNTPLGVIEFINPIHKNQFDKSDLRLAKYFSSLAASSLVSLNLHNHEERHSVLSNELQNALSNNADMTSLLRLAGEISREPNLNSLLLRILERSRAWMKADACSIFLVDDASGELVLNTAQGSSTPQLGLIRVPAGKGICGAAMQDKVVIKVDDVSKDERFFGSADKQTGYQTKAMIAAPLLDGERCFGVIEFLNPLSADTFDSSDVQLVEYFSSLVSSSLVRIKAHEAQLEHAVFQRDLDLAREMQSGLLPTRFPDCQAYPEIDLYATLAPALEVSGDLYDFFETKQGKLCFLVGDVSGKGVAAGLFMAVTRTLIRAIAVDQELDPVEVLRRINTYLVPDNSAMLFVTIILGFLDPKTGDIVYAQGGHNPPLYLSGAGDATYEPPGGQPVGVFDDASFGLRHISLNPGDGLCIYTDGVTEAMDSLHNQYGEERFQKLMIHREKLTAKELCDVVLSSVKDFAGSAEQSDDITLMVIKRR